MRYLLIAVLIAGCTTPEKRAETLMERYGPICDRFGYQQGTDKWRDCVLAQTNATASRPSFSVVR